ncbi:MAG: OmpL47-type beta-barrel domain-containing protein [Candidatus Heimdallarchaeota archaeon]
MGKSAKQEVRKLLKLKPGLGLTFVPILLFVSTCSVFEPFIMDYIGQEGDNESKFDARGLSMLLTEQKSSRTTTEAKLALQTQDPNMNSQTTALPLSRIKNFTPDSQEMGIGNSDSQNETNTIMAWDPTQPGEMLEIDPAYGVFQEVIRGASYRHFYNTSSKTFHYESAKAVYNPSALTEFEWLLPEEYPIRFILRDRAGQVFHYTLDEIINLFRQFDNSSLTSIGIEGFSGASTFYMNFEDHDWGHGQYFWFPRLQNTSLASYSMPMYQYFPHLYLNASGVLRDAFLPADNSARNHIRVENDTESLRLWYCVNQTVLGYSFYFEHGLKYKYASHSFGLITTVRCLDSSFEDIAFTYDGTYAPQTVGTGYMPEFISIYNETLSRRMKANDVWNIGIELENIDPKISVTSKNGNKWKFDFKDMQSAGFTKYIVDSAEQLFPGRHNQIGLRIGMSGYGDYIQGTTIDIDPSFTETMETDERDFYVTSAGTAVIDETTVNIGHSQMGVESRAFVAFDTGIKTAMTGVAPYLTVNLEGYIDTEQVEPGESFAGGIYFKGDADDYWSESEAAANPSGAYAQGVAIANHLYDADGMAGAYRSLNGYPSGTLYDDDLVEYWRDNRDPTDQYIAFKFWPTDMGSGTLDYVRIREASYSGNYGFKLSFDFSAAPHVDALISGPGTILAGVESTTTIDYGFPGDMDADELFIRFLDSSDNYEVKCVWSSSSGFSTTVNPGYVSSVTGTKTDISTAIVRMEWKITFDWDWPMGSDYDILTACYDASQGWSTEVRYEAGTSGFINDLEVTAFSLGINAVYDAGHNGYITDTEWFKGGEAVNASGTVRYTGTSANFDSSIASGVSVQLFYDTTGDDVLDDLGNSFDDPVISSGAFSCDLYTPASTAGTDTTAYFDVTLQGIPSGGSDSTAGSIAITSQRDNSVPTAASVIHTDSDNGGDGYGPSNGWDDDTTADYSVSGAQDTGAGLHASPYSWRWNGAGWGGWTSDTTFTVTSAWTSDNQVRDADCKVSDNVGNEAIFDGENARRDMGTPTLTDAMSGYSETGDTGDAYGVIASNIFWFSNSIPSGVTVTFTATATDTCGIYGIDYGSFGENPVIDTSSPYRGSYFITNSDATGSLSVIAVDVGGNIASSSITCNEDAGNPSNPTFSGSEYGEGTGDGSSAINRAWNSNGTTLPFDGDSDSLSGIAGFYYQLDGGSWSSLVSSVDVDSFLTDGIHTVTVQAEDNVGNQAAVQTYYVGQDGVDPTNPTFSGSEHGEGTGDGSSAANRAWNQNSTALTFDGDADTHSGVAGFYYQVDSGGWSSLVSSVDMDSLLTDGTHTVTVQAEDNVGNQAGAYTYYIGQDGVDPSNPSISNHEYYDGGSSRYWNRMSTSFITDGEADIHSGPAGFYYKIDGGGTAGPVASLDLSGLAQGTHTIEVWAVDNVGNQAGVQTYYVGQDGATPSNPAFSGSEYGEGTGDGSSAANRAWNQNSTLLTVDGDADTHSGVAGFYYQIDSGGWSSLVSSVDVDSLLTDGPHTITVRAEDNVGNQATVQTYYVGQDGSGPTYATTTVPTAGAYGSTYTGDANTIYTVGALSTDVNSVADSLSGIPTADYTRYKLESWTTSWQTAIAWTNWDFEAGTPWIVAASSLIDGTKYRIVIQVRDNVGVQTEVMSDDIIVDKTATTGSSITGVQENGGTGSDFMHWTTALFYNDHVIATHYFNVTAQFGTETNPWGIWFSDGFATHPQAPGAHFLATSPSAQSNAYYIDNDWPGTSITMRLVDKAGNYEELTLTCTPDLIITNPGSFDLTYTDSDGDSDGGVDEVPESGYDDDGNVAISLSTLPSDTGGAGILPTWWVQYLLQVNGTNSTWGVWNETTLRSYATLEDGEYVLYARVRDFVNNTAEIASVLITVDTGTPAYSNLLVEENHDGLFYNNSREILYYSQFYNNKEFNLTCNILDANPWKILYPSAFGSSGSTPETAPWRSNVYAIDSGEQENFLKLTVYDRAGNALEVNLDCVEDRQDTNPPVPSSIVCSDGTYTDGTFTITLTSYSDAFSGIPATYFSAFRLNSGSWTAWQIGDSLDYINLPEDTYQIDVLLRDNVNNTATTSVTVYFDGTPPASGLFVIQQDTESSTDSYGPGIGFDDDGVLTGSFTTLPSDSISGLDTGNGYLRYKIDFGTWSVWSTNTDFTSSALPDGSHNVSVEIRDKAGNSIVVTTPNITVDTQGGVAQIVEIAEASPYLYFNSSTSILYYSAQMSTGQTFIIVTSITDANPYSVVFSAAFNNVQNTATTSLYNSTAYTVFSTSTDTSIVLTCVDGAGNAVTQNLLCVKDISSPGEPAIAGYSEERNSTYWSRSDQLLFLMLPLDNDGAGMEAGNIQYRFNQDGWQTYTFGINISTFVEGEVFNLTYYARDSVGNPGQLTTINGKVVNYLAPVIEEVTFAELAGRAANATIAVKARDPANLPVLVEGYCRANTNDSWLRYRFVFNSSTSYFEGSIPLKGLDYRDQMQFYINVTNLIPLSVTDDNYGAYYVFEIGDFQAPDFEMVAYPNGSISNDVLPALRVRAIDAGAGINIHEVWLVYRVWKESPAFVAWQRRSLDWDSVTRSFEPSSAEPWGPFSHDYTVEYYIEATDAALTPNTGTTAIFSFVVKDTTAPMVSIPLETLQLTTDQEGYYSLTLEITDPDYITLLLLNYTTNAGATWESLISNDTSRIRQLSTRKPFDQLLALQNTRTAQWNLLIGDDVNYFSFCVVVADEHGNTAFYGVNEQSRFTAYGTAAEAEAASLQNTITNAAYQSSIPEDGMNQNELVIMALLVIAVGLLGFVAVRTLLKSKRPQITVETIAHSRWSAEGPALEVADLLARGLQKLERLEMTAAISQVNQARALTSPAQDLELTIDTIKLLAHIHLRAYLHSRRATHKVEIERLLQELGELSQREQLHKVYIESLLLQGLLKRALFDLPGATGQFQLAEKGAEEQGYRGLKRQAQDELTLLQRGTWALEHSQQTSPEAYEEAQLGEMLQFFERINEFAAALRRAFDEEE